MASPLLCAVSIILVDYSRKLRELTFLAKRLMSPKKAWAVVAYEIIQAFNIS